MGGGPPRRPGRRGGARQGQSGARLFGARIGGDEQALLERQAAFKNTHRGRSIVQGEERATENPAGVERRGMLGQSQARETVEGVVRDRDRLRRLAAFELELGLVHAHARQHGVAFVEEATEDAERPLEAGRRFRVTPQCDQRVPELAQRLAGGRVVAAVDALQAGQVGAQHALGGGGLAAGDERAREVDLTVERLLVERSMQAPGQGDGLAEDLLRLVELATVAQHIAEIGQAERQNVGITTRAT